MGCDRPLPPSVHQMGLVLGPGRGRVKPGPRLGRGNGAGRDRTPHTCMPVCACVHVTRARVPRVHEHVMCACVHHMRMNVCCVHVTLHHMCTCHTCTRVSCMCHIGSRVHECASCVHECVSRACHVASRVRDCVLRVCMNVWPVRVTLHHVCTRVRFTRAGACAHARSTAVGPAGTHAVRTAGPRSRPRTRTGRWRRRSSRGLRCSCRCGCSRVPSAHCHRLQHSPVTQGRPGGAPGHHSPAGVRGLLPAPGPPGSGWRSVRGGTADRVTYLSGS